MKEHVRALLRRCGTASSLARVMGVSLDTVRSWAGGRRTPVGVEWRLLAVLGTLANDAPFLLDALAGKPGPPARCQPINLVPVSDEVLREIAAQRERQREVVLRREEREDGVTAPAVASSVTWDDAYWHAHTAPDGEEPLLGQDIPLLIRMSDGEEMAYWAACDDYCRRTGRDTA